MKSNPVSFCCALAVILFQAGCGPRPVPVESSASVPPPEGKPRVWLEGEAGNWRLMREGQEVFIHGAAGDGDLALLLETGGNAVRTYGKNATLDRLPAIRESGLHLIPGYWLPHERHGFSYDDEAALARIREDLRDFVLALRDEPGVLVWALGNEMEGDGRNPRIWNVINDLAAMVKELDDRPVMTILAGASPVKLEAFGLYCPNVDILGINSYGGLPRVQERMREFLPETPYIICEFGAHGPWERPKAPWGAELEQSSTEKAEIIGSYWREHIAANRGRCLGGFVFRWGWKQEATHTWFGLMLKDGSPTSIIDALQHAWTGEWPEERGPVVTRLGEGIRYAELEPDGLLELNVLAESPSALPLSYEWELYRESHDRRHGGDAEATPERLSDYLSKADTAEVILRAPSPGAYRLFITIRDANGKAATANIPILVR